MDRVAVARERLQANRTLAVKAREAGPPCLDCRYRTLFNACGNPAYVEQRFEPSTGRFQELFDTPISTARSDDGLCGPEALLFEPQLPAVAIIKPVWNGIGTAGLILAAAIAVAGVSAQLFHWPILISGW